MSRISLRTLIALAAVLALAAVPAVAQAHQGSTSGKSKKHRKHAKKRATKADRNADGLTDSWERHFGLSLKVDQSGRDQDHDGLKNKQEFKAGTNPCDRDSDDDGVGDKHENAGKITSFDAQTQVLTIELVAGGTISGKVTAQTEIKCRATAPATTPTTATAASRDGSEDRSGSDDGPGHDAGDDHPSTTTPPAGTTPTTSHHEDEGDDDHHDGDHGATTACGTAQLTAGTAVHEAEIKVTQDGSVFDELKLVLPAPATPAT